MWERYELIFDLKSPLHIGYLPSGVSVLAPTRYYIPGKNFWGAITQRITEIIFDTPISKDYRQIGQIVKENFRFSYFYVYDGGNVYSPCYDPNGIYYGTKGKEKITEQEFQYRYIRSRVLTELDSNTGSAKDKSLHEIESINEKFIDNKGSIKNSKIIGTVWIKEREQFYEDVKLSFNDDGIYIDEFNIFEELTIGGERNIGFGKIELNSFNIGKNYYTGMDESINKGEIVIETKNGSPIINHVSYNEQLGFHGDIELLSGRQYYNNNNSGKIKGKKQYEKPGEYIVVPKYYFAPGTVFIMENKDSLYFVLVWNGTLVKR